MLSHPWNVLSFMTTGQNSIQRHTAKHNGISLADIHLSLTDSCHSPASATTQLGTTEGQGSLRCSVGAHFTRLPPSSVRATDQHCSQCQFWGKRQQRPKRSFKKPESRTLHITDTHWSISPKNVSVLWLEVKGANQKTDFERDYFEMIPTILST